VWQATHLGGGDVSDIFDDLDGQIPNMFIFVYVQADNRIHSCTHTHTPHTPHTHVNCIHTYCTLILYNLYKVCTVVVEDNLAIGMVQAKIAEDFKAVSQCISRVVPYERQSK
jgi:hypothetical protein